jgi:hypothetical protein
MHDWITLYFAKYVIAEIRDLFGSFLRPVPSIGRRVKLNPRERNGRRIVFRK